MTCQGSVPQAIEAFLESTDFEDAIRGAISIGGDSDTITETLKRTFEVDADDQCDAEQMMSDGWHDSKYIFGYARASTEQQNLDRQLDALRKYDVDVIYSESRGIFSSPGLETMVYSALLHNRVGRMAGLNF